MFCGDFNVQGMPDKDGLRPEWTALLDKSIDDADQVLQDAWPFEQCPGRLLLGTTPLPDDCDPGITAHAQRLDYVLRPKPYPGRMVAQHIRIAHDVAQISPTSPTKYTSDHLPLSIDLNEARRFNTANTAEKLKFTIDDPENTSTATLRDGEMHWYRIDDPGGFGFAMVGGTTKVFARHLHQSRPFAALSALRSRHHAAHAREPWRRPLRPGRGAVLRPSVFAAQLTNATYTLYSRRFIGTGPKDAIPLMRSWPVRGEARVGAPHSDDNPDTGVDDFDSVWFTARLDRTYPGVNKYT